MVSCYSSEKTKVRLRRAESFPYPDGKEVSDDGGEQDIGRHALHIFERRIGRIHGARCAGEDALEQVRDLLAEAGVSHVPMTGSAA